MWSAAFTLLDVFGATLLGMSLAPAVAPPMPPPATSAGTRWRRWRWLDSLRAKLFLGIAGVNGLVVLLAYLVNGWSFEQGLVSYLNRADETRLAPLVERLGRDFGAHGNWQWLVDDHDAWHQVLAETLGVPPPREREGRPASSPGTRRPDDRPVG
jgi:two-component system, OmpR family, sensor histidine kinase BaeS